MTKAAQPFRALVTRCAMAWWLTVASASQAGAADPLAAAPSDDAGKPVATAASAAPANVTAERQRPEKPLDLTAPVIRAAVAAADRDYAPSARRGTAFGTERSARQDRIDRQFEAATIESCVGAGAYKFDPPTIGFIGFGGYLALPWLLHAMATGRCKLTLDPPPSETVGVRSRFDERRDLAPVPFRRAPFS